MDSAFIALAKAIAALLAAGPPVADKITRSRAAAMPRENSSLVNVRLLGSKAERAAVAGGPMDWNTTFEIECCKRADADAAPLDAVDPVLQAAYERLAGQGAALALGVEDVLPDPEIDWDSAEGETPIAVATFTVSVVHRTEALTLAPRN